MSDSIAQRIDQIRTQLSPRVRLIAISKQVSAEAIREAYAAGIRDFGESRIQEALPKQQQLQDLNDVCWHFIGHLQRNKARLALNHFQWIHAVDSLKLAQQLNRLATEADFSVKTRVCLQVKVLPDPGKYGWQIPDLLVDLLELDECTELDIQGLMTILPLGLSRTQALAAFKETRALAQKIEQQNWSHLKMQELSMGMSADYLLAVEAGATMIRLGSSIFGERPKSG